MSKLVLLWCSFGRERVPEWMLLILWLKRNPRWPILPVPGRKYSRLFSCASENLDRENQRQLLRWDWGWCWVVAAHLPSEQRGSSASSQQSEPGEDSVKLLCGKNAFFRSCKLCVRR